MMQTANRVLRWSQVVGAGLLAATTVSAQRGGGPHDVDALPSSAAMLVAPYGPCAPAFGEFRLPTGSALALPKESPARGSDPLRVAAAVAIDRPADVGGLVGRDAQICGKPVIAPLMGGTPAEQPARYRDNGNHVDVIGPGRAAFPAVLSFIRQAMGIARLAAGGQQPLNWAADDGQRVATLERDGTRLDGEHVILWFPKSLSPSDASALVKRLDPGVAGLWRRVGVHEWQSVPKGKITFYLSDDSFVSHASGRAAVFVPMARVKDGRAPYLHEAAHEVFASTRVAQPSAGGPIRRPLWLTEGLADYVSRLVSADVGTPEEAGPFNALLADADALCAERAGTSDGATMLAQVGGNEAPAVLFTTDRSRFAPTFYTCSLSFVRYLDRQVGLDALVALFAYEPAEMIARLDALRGKRISEWRTAWLKELKL